MKKEIILIAVVVILLVGIAIFLLSQPHSTVNNPPSCPANCTAGCLPDNVTCNPNGKNLCANITCTDKCEDSSMLDTKGECDPSTGSCTYKRNLCAFGCENSSCRSVPLCPENCPFGCEPGTSVCITPTCPVSCPYGCIAGTTHCSSIPPSSSIKNGDFEAGYMGWNVSGNAFGSAPTDASFVNSHQLYRGVPYSGYSGTFFASSYFPQMDKGAMGNITSEPFFINKNYLEFLVVGDYSGALYVALIVNGTVVDRLNPDNSYPPFERVTWNVTKYKGKLGIIKVVDASVTASIDLDDFMLVDSPSLQYGEPYIDSYANYSIIPPRNWEVINGTVSGQVIIYGPSEKNFTSQLMVTAEPVSPDETSEIYYEKAKTGFSLLLQNYTINAESNITIGTLYANQIDYTYTLGGVNVENREILLVSNGFGYRISATSAESSFNAQIGDFNSSIQSFKIG